MRGERPAHSGCPPEDVIDAFEAALLATGWSRLERQQFWALWARADPAWAGSEATRLRLSTALASLADAGSITLPAPGGRLWDTGLPSLPTRVGVPVNRRPGNRLPDPAEEPWTPAMSLWAPAWIRASRPPQRLRSAAVQVNRWLLATTGTNPPRVAREERSLHIFNDEKQLAALTGTALFNDGRLTLDALSCDAPLGALRIATLRPEGPVLIVENKSTFDSAWRAQRAAESPAYAAIIFGAGDAATALLTDLRELPSTLGVAPTSFEYAGDVDIAGIEAAAAFASLLASAGLPVTMAHPLWDAVARSEPTGEDITADRERTPQAAEAARMLGLPQAVIERLSEGVRIPQERIDRTALADTRWWRPATPERRQEAAIIEALASPSTAASSTFTSRIEAGEPRGQADLASIGNPDHPFRSR
jgi:hypothetical protein